MELGVDFNQHLTKKNLSSSNWQEFIGGYCLLLDMTEHAQTADALVKTKVWLQAKARDRFLVLSDFIPVEDIKDPHNVELEFKLNVETT